MHSSTARRLQTSLRLACKSIPSSRQAKRLRPFGVHAHPHEGTAIRFASSKQDSKDGLSNPLAAAAGGFDESPASQTYRDGMLEISSDTTEYVPELKSGANTILEYTSSGPAIGVRDGLEDMSHYDPEADRFGQEFDRDQVNQHSPNLLGISDSDLYEMPVEPIPPLPPWPEYPALHITDVDLQEFIIPLYSRKWYIPFKFKKGIMNAKAWQKCPTLSRNYDLSTFEATMDFVTEIAKISQAEDHFPNVTFEGKQVFINTYTSSAFLDTNQGDLTNRQRPGLTLRDARIAILVEQTFARHFLANGYGHPGKAEVHPKYETPDTMQVIERAREMSGTLLRNSERSKPPAPHRCIVCDGEHDSIWCSQRYTRSPPAGLRCKYCKEEGHWWMNCTMPRRNKKKEKVAEWRTRLFGTTPFPPKPCPECGGNHWSSDCPALKRKNVKPPVLDMYVRNI